MTYAISAIRVLLNGPAAATDHSVGVTILLAIVILTVMSAGTMALATSRFRNAVH